MIVVVAFEGKEMSGFEHNILLDVEVAYPCTITYMYIHCVAIDVS